MLNNNNNELKELKPFECPVFINMKWNWKIEIRKKYIYKKPERNSPSRPYEQSGDHPSRKP